jgi:hypothetical protein
MKDRWWLSGRRRRDRKVNEPRNDFAFPQLIDTKPDEQRRAEHGLHKHNARNRQ